MAPELPHQSSTVRLTPSSIFSLPFSSHYLTTSRRQLLLWLDDCLLYNRDISALLHIIRALIKFCARSKWKLHPRKCVLFTKSVKWYGRAIASHVIRYGPSNLDGLLGMECPTTGGQLQKFLCEMQWLRSSITKFQSIVTALHEFLEVVCKQVGKRTKRAASRIPLASLVWNSTLNDNFEA